MIYIPWPLFHNIWTIRRICQSLPIKCTTPDTSQCPANRIPSTYSTISPTPSRFSPSPPPIATSLQRIHPHQQHPPRLPLHTLPHLHHPAIRRHIHALPHAPQPLHIPPLIPLTQLEQVPEPHPHPPRRLRHHLHPSEHGFIIPVLQPHP